MDEKTAKLWIMDGGMGMPTVFDVLADDSVHKDTPNWRYLQLRPCGDFHANGIVKMAKIYDGKLTLSYKRTRHARPKIREFEADKFQILQPEKVQTFDGWLDGFSGNVPAQMEKWRHELVIGATHDWGVWWANLTNGRSVAIINGTLNTKKTEQENGE